MYFFMCHPTLMEQNVKILTQRKSKNLLSHKIKHGKSFWKNMYMYHEHENLYNKLGQGGREGGGGGWKENKKLKV